MHLSKVENFINSAAFRIKQPTVTSLAIPSKSKKETPLFNFKSSKSTLISTTGSSAPTVSPWSTIKKENPEDEAQKIKSIQHNEADSFEKLNKLLTIDANILPSKIFKKKQCVRKK